MAEHVAEDLNLDRLAAQAGLSKFHFHRLFKRCMGGKLGTIFARAAQLVAELAYTGEDGPELAYRFEWLKR
jgi:AraC-like DNA-binding protein